LDESRQSTNNGYFINLSQYLNEQVKKVSGQAIGEPVQSTIIDFERFGLWTSSQVKCLFFMFLLLWSALGLPISLIAYVFFGTLNIWNAIAERQPQSYYLPERPSCFSKFCAFLL